MSRAETNRAAWWRAWSAAYIPHTGPVASANRGAPVRTSSARTGHRRSSSPWVTRREGEPGRGPPGRKWQAERRERADEQPAPPRHGR